MEIVTGGITTGDDFFEGRKPYVDELAKLISTNDILLVGPRRTGKTSLIKEYLLREKESKGINTRFTNQNKIDDQTQPR